VPALTREGQKICMTAFSTSDPGKAVMKNPAVQVAVNDGPEIGAVKPIGSLKPFLIDPFEVLGSLNKSRVL